VLAEAFDPELVAARPVARVEAPVGTAPGGPAAVPGGDTDYSDEEEDVIRERLKALGYIEE
jgi:hypothetical protein